MANSIDDLRDGSFLRFERGRATQGRRVFQRVYPAGKSGLAAIKTDFTLPQIGDAWDDVDYPQLRMVDVDLRIVSLDDQGRSICKITADYVDMSEIHVEGGSTTAGILTPFDADGNLIVVSREGDQFIAQIEQEESRGYMVIERVFTFGPAVETIEAWIKDRENRVNHDTFAGQPARCWRLARIEYELLFERIAFGSVLQQIYRLRFFCERRPARLVELYVGETKTSVPGWDAIVSYEADGVVPSDAVFTVKQRYQTLDFASLFTGVTL